MDDQPEDTYALDAHDAERRRYFVRITPERLESLAGVLTRHILRDEFRERLARFLEARRRQWRRR